MNKLEMHGRLGDVTWQSPQLKVMCCELARPGYNAGRAHEFLDHEKVLHSKVSILAGLVRKSKRLVIYAGAGLSTASGIRDYATRKDGVVSKDEHALKQPASPYSAKPNFGHKAIAALCNAGFLWRFVQQNHDGLPQKAGVPQHVMNEIHGAWFDPSNPVVMMGGNLREDLFEDLLECERQADLVLALGTSLCGMNADRVVTTCAKKARLKDYSSTVYGSVIIGLQRTVLDKDSSVRIFATINRAMELLLESLSTDVIPLGVSSSTEGTHRPLGSDVEVFSVPYDENGCINSSGARRLWDLTDGSTHRVTLGPYKDSKAVVLGKNEDGHYNLSVSVSHPINGATCEVKCVIGDWWVVEAVAGKVKYIPTVSCTEPGSHE